MTKAPPPLCSPFYGRACRWAMLGELKPNGPKAPKHQSTKAPKMFSRKEAGLFYQGDTTRFADVSTEQLPVSAYGGSLKNLKDLKDLLTILRKPKCFSCSHFYAYGRACRWAMSGEVMTQRTFRRKILFDPADGPGLEPCQSGDV
jgi:hypothetical protein